LPRKLDFRFPPLDPPPPGPHRIVLCLLGLFYAYSVFLFFWFLTPRECAVFFLLVPLRTNLLLSTRLLGRSPVSFAGRFFFFLTSFSEPHALLFLFFLTFATSSSFFPVVFSRGAVFFFSAPRACPPFFPSPARLSSLEKLSLLRASRFFSPPSRDLSFFVPFSRRGGLFLQRFSLLSL